MVQLIASELNRLSIFDVEVTAAPHFAMPLHLIRYNAEYGGCRELMLIRRVLFSQDTIAFNPADSKYVWRIGVEGEYVDYTQKKSLGSFQFRAEGWGAGFDDAETAAFTDLKRKVRFELKAVYYFSSPILGVVQNRLKIQGGKQQGITKGMLFDIVHPGLDAATETAFPDHLIGIASVVHCFEDSSLLKIRRIWHPLNPHCLTVERLGPLAAGQVYAAKSAVSDNLGFAFEARPHAIWDWGFGLFYKRILDSRNENAHGFGFSGMAGLHFLRCNWGSFCLNAALEMSILLKKDDDGEMVSAPNFSIPIGLMTAWKLTHRFDLITGVGYRIGTESSQWDYTDNETVYPAHWKNRRPAVNETGVFISSGIRMWFF